MADSRPYLGIVYCSFAPLLSYLDEQLYSAHEGGLLPDCGVYRDSAEDAQRAVLALVVVSLQEVRQNLKKKSAKKCIYL